MPTPTDTERSLAGKVAAHESWARTENRSARTANARQALENKFLAEAGGDPIKAEQIRQAFYARLQLKSAQSRRKAKEARARANRLEHEADQADAELAGASPPTPATPAVSGVTTSPSKSRKAAVDSALARLDGGGDHAA